MQRADQRGRYGRLAGTLLVAAALLLVGAEVRGQSAGTPQVIAPSTGTAPGAPPRSVLPPRAAQSAPPNAAPVADGPREAVEADVSTRSVAVTSSFTGTEIVVFGSIVNAARPDATQTVYDIVVVVEGTSQALVARRKSRVAGIWINTQSLTFESVPSYYAIASTRPLDEIADAIVLRDNDIGFERVRMTPIRGWETGITTSDLQQFRQAAIRLKQKDGLYTQSEFGVTFVGTHLFRATIDLPANVPVGPLKTRIYLFREGQVVGTFNTEVTMAREGLERHLHTFAFEYPLFYGIFTVLTAVLAGLVASTLFKRARH
ncbi:MAG: TIGR02186 family protein [Hyphomicrobiaceae bacterium]